MIYENQINMTPPSYNTFRQKHWRVEQKAKKLWQEWFELLIMECGIPRNTFTKCRARVFLRFPDKRTRDLGNFRVMVEKALPDALVAGGWLPDDSHSHFDLEVFKFEEALGPRRTYVILEMSGADVRKL